MESAEAISDDEMRRQIEEIMRAPLPDPASAPTAKPLIKLKPRSSGLPQKPASGSTKPADSHIGPLRTTGSSNKSLAATSNSKTLYKATRGTYAEKFPRHKPPAEIETNNPLASRVASFKDRLTKFKEESQLEQSKLPRTSNTKPQTNNQLKITSLNKKITK